MPSASKKDRKNARHMRRKFNDLKYLGSLSGGLVGLYGIAILGTGPLIIPVAGIGAVLGALSVYGHHKAATADEIANDPPRDDYFESATVDEPVIDYSIFGQDEASILTAEVLRLGFRATAFEHAMVQADERALGADRDSATATATARRDESAKLGAEAARLNIELAAAMLKLGDLLAKQPSRISPDQLAAGRELVRRYPAGIPGEVVALMANAGLKPEPFTDEDLRQVDERLDLTRALDPIGALAIELREAGDASLAFGRDYLESHGHRPTEMT